MDIVILQCSEARLQAEKVFALCCAEVGSGVAESSKIQTTDKSMITMFKLE